MTTSENSVPKLVDTDWLAAHLDDANLVVVEVNEKPELYAEGHIPGAVRLHWRDDLQAELSRDIVDQATFEQLLGSRGIDAGSTVVLYGDRDNWFAAYAYWYFKNYGHADVRILDGGRSKWIAEGRELTTEAPTVTPTTYTVTAANPAIRAFSHEVRAGLDDTNRRLVDVRSPAEFSGELLAPADYANEGAQRAGHIPGAVSIPWSSTVNADSTFKSTEELLELYSSKGVTADRDVIAYCRIGERSAHTWFVLHELLGFPEVRNYDGSWSEWGSLVGAPIEVDVDKPASSAVC
ncbi:MAG: sulfurtransferase [Thermoleophilia bacterium]|jgi:thiosulfate/3-mercaptopyruvate sulfurtransferase|nr:sulfurtransferase [Thermoleophilia bacterium]